MRCKENINTTVLTSKSMYKQYFTYTRQEMLKFVPSNAKRILDVGCGGGIFGSIVKSNLNSEVWGVEICQEAATNAMSKLDCVIAGDFESDNIRLPLNYFDCIVFNDVLEHFKDPWTILSKSSRYLKEDGFIIASIPNLRYFYTLKELVINKEWKYVDAGILDKTHLRFFTEKTIKDMFQACGYRIINIEGINAIEFPWKFRLFNLLMMNKFEDMKYNQFACVAQKIEGHG